MLGVPLALVMVVGLLPGVRTAAYAQASSGITASVSSVGSGGLRVKAGRAGAVESFVGAGVALSASNAAPVLGLSQPPVTDYPLWVGDAQVTSANATNITGGETVAASYDATTNTLTLNGASITTGHDVSTYYPGTGDTVVDTYSIYYSGSDALNIVLNGTNSVKSPEFDNAIHSENANADINISGNGSLTLECDNSGIFARGVLTINSGSLIASGTGTGSSGVTAHKGIVVKGGNVEVSGTGAGMTSYDGEIKIEGGTVTAAGVGNSAEDGICAGKGVTISGGTVVASSANNGVSSDEGTITIEGGSLTASGADGIWADKGNVVIAGGNVTSTGTDGVAFYGKEIVIGKDIVSVSGSGTNGVFGSNYDEGRKVYSDPIVKIAAAGVGWTDTAGTQGRAYIPANAGEGHKLPYKKVQFYATPSPAHTPAATRVPMANTLTYTGFAQELVTAGVAERGTFYYALGTDAAIAPAFGWRASIPTGTNAGTYYVWYKVVAGDGSLVTGPQVIVVAIRGAGGSVPTSYGWSSRSHSSNTSSTSSTPAVRRLGMYRLYNPMAGEHLYTANVSEKDSLVAGGWTNEGAAFYVPSTSNTPVWRVFNPATGEHHLTTSKDERDQLTRGGWTDEGVGFYADDAKGKAMHRLFDPKANPVASHHFTSSDEERQDLIAAGWIDEGIGFYVLS